MRYLNYYLSDTTMNILIKYPSKGKALNSAANYQQASGLPIAGRLTQGNGPMHHRLGNIAQ